MESLYLLVPLSVIIVLGVLIIFAWALFGGQFDDIEREGERILEDEALEQDLAAQIRPTGSTPASELPPDDVKR